MPKKAARRLLLPPVSPAVSGPLYQQIVEGIKRELSVGRIIPGQPLPSFRNLAEDLLVSLITVKRAYEELEREGILFRKQGLGTFISENGVARSRNVKKKRAEALIRQGIQEASEAGLSETEIKNLIDGVKQKQRGGKRP